MSAEDYIGYLYEDDAWDGSEPREIHANVVVHETVKATLFADDTGMFWVPKIIHGKVKSLGDGVVTTAPEWFRVKYVGEKVKEK